MTRILVTGRTGQVGWELQRALPAVGEVVALDRGQLDLSSPDSIRAAIREFRPAIIVNAAAYTNVDQAESESGLAHRINAIAPGILAEEARRLSAVLVHYSTDYVFDGALSRPYVERDTPHPVNEYGKSKLAGERAIEAVGGAYLILRTSWLYAARGVNFLLTMLRLATQKRELPIVDDQVGSPTWARSLALATAQILGQTDAVRGAPGVYHLSAAGSTTRYDFVRAIFDIAAREWRLQAPVLKRTSTANYPFPVAARRPLNAVTSKQKIKEAFGLEMDGWRRQLEECMNDPAAQRAFLEILAKAP